MGVGAMLGKNNTAVRKWSVAVAPRLGRGLAAQKDGEVDDGSLDMDARIIMREARCSLEEPKPLRFLEMKKMMLLCREKVPVRGTVYKDRVGVA